MSKSIPPKTEPTGSDFDPVNLESEILQLCLQYPNGITVKILENTFRNVTLEQHVTAINRLLSLGRIDLLKSSSEPGTFLYRIKDTNKIGNGMTDQREKTVYQLIKESGNIGIWMRNIRYKTQLSETLLNKTLKSLESKKLIKAVKSVQANRKKVYMLYELTPDVSVSGDIWICNNELDEELVRVLTEQCARLLNERLEQALEKFPNDPFLRRTSSFISSTEVASLINDMGFANVTLTVQNIESILNILICDGKIEKMTVAPTENGIKQNLYRSIQSILDASPVVRNPCGICPVFNDCHDEGVITPKTCIYLNKWLDF